MRSAFGLWTKEHRRPMEDRMQSPPQGFFSRTALEKGDTMKSARERAQISSQTNIKLLLERITVTWPRLLASLTLAVVCLSPVSSAQQGPLTPPQLDQLVARIALVPAP